MKHNDFIRGYNQGYNYGHRPSYSPPRTETKVVERVVYDDGASDALVIAVENQRQIIEEQNADMVEQNAVIGTLKKALHEVAPEHPLVNPIRTKNNPILQKVGESAREYYLETGEEPTDPEYEALALSKGEPWVDEEEPASVEPDDPVQSRSEEGEPGVEGKPVKEKKGGFWGWFNNPTGVGA